MSGRPPSVVHVVCTAAFAGVERYVTTLARVQAARGARVQVLGGDPARMPAELEGTAVRWQPAPSLRAAVSGLRRLREVGLVHAHMTEAETAAVLAARAPVVCTRHFDGTRGSSPAARLVGRAVGARIREQVAISRFVAASIEGPSTVLHPGVPAPVVPAEERRPVVLMAQRLEAEKRTDLGLRTWAASGLADDGWRLLIAGSGALAGDLTQLAGRLGVAGSCELLGHRADVAELLATAGVFLAPRPDEPYGLSVVEAMAHGTPVVAAAGGGHDETVGSVDGAVMVPADPAEAGHLLAELARDEARLTAYGSALRTAHRERFTVEAHADGLETVYAKALE